MQFKDYYAVLGVARDASEDEPVAAVEQASRVELRVPIGARGVLGVRSAFLSGLDGELEHECGREAG